MRTPTRFTAIIAGLLIGCATAATTKERFAAEDALFKADMLALWNKQEIMALHGKTVVWDSDITPSMTIDPTLPTDDERRAMIKWADSLSPMFGRYRDA